LNNTDPKPAPAVLLFGVFGRATFAPGLDRVEAVKVFEAQLFEDPPPGLKVPAIESSGPTAGPFRLRLIGPTDFAKGRGELAAALAVFLTRNPETVVCTIRPGLMNPPEPVVHLAQGTPPARPSLWALYDKLAVFAAPAFDGLTHSEKSELRGELAALKSAAVLLEGERGPSARRD
jgi:hypothetical protein